MIRSDPPIPDDQPQTWVNGDLVQLPTGEVVGITEHVECSKDQLLKGIEDGSIPVMRFKV